MNVNKTKKWIIIDECSYAVQESNEEKNEKKTKKN